ncbi:MAG: threonine synthase [Gammaproteobacteria bacterium]|nr:MAG: threonine synthase [Gammaproteobacteria bacterium]
MIFTETRGNDGSHEASVSFSEALLSPMASFGGIYSPQEMHPVAADFLRRHIDSSYQEMSLALLEHLEIDIETPLLRQALDLYRRFDDPDDPVPLVKFEDRLFVSELYHGPTRAFKDMALQPFGLILSTLARQQDRQFLILTATSGDTGPAALETFRGRANIRVACLYPDGGTSDVQRLQMVTEAADNLKVIGIHGNFDDAQSALKTLLASETFNQRLREMNISLSAANSVNFGRIIFQMLYQFHSYLALVRWGEIELGDEVVLHIPSGNFGNALGAYYARGLGLPIAKIVIASNANNVLTEWIDSGRYDLSKRDLIATTSPAMDILKSSNVERVLFDLFGATRTRELMQQLDDNGWYQLSPQEHDPIRAIFAADFCTDEESLHYIREGFAQGYLMDPHTATCFKTCRLPEFAGQVNIVYSTAEWTKFAPVIDEAINGNRSQNDRAALDAVAASAQIDVPAIIDDLFDKPVAHPGVVEKNAIEAEILDFLTGSD